MRIQANAFRLASALTLAVFMAAPIARATESVVIPLDLSGPRPTAQLTIGAHPPATVIFDTGASGSVLNAEFGESVGLPNEGDVHIGSPGGQKKIPAYLSTLPAARLGGADITGARVVVGDLGLPLDGIAGVASPNMFKGSLVLFELAQSRVVIAAKSPATIPTDAFHPYDGQISLPSIKIDVAGVELAAHIDTGSGRDLSLPLEIADRIPLKAPLTPAKPARMAGGEHAAYTSRIDGVVRIGPITLVDPDVTFIEQFPYANVGFSLLKDLTIVLDPAEKRSWLLATTRL